MTGITTHWNNIYAELTAKAERCRDSQTVSFGLLSAYDKLTETERMSVHDIIAGWLVSDDEKLRYDAALLTSERRIVELDPAVEAAIDRAVSQAGPQAVYEMKKLSRILQDLRS